MQRDVQACVSTSGSSSPPRSQIVNTCSGGKCRLGALHLKWDPRGCPSGLHSPNNHAFHLGLHLYYLLVHRATWGRLGGGFHAHFTEVCLKLEPTQLVRTPSGTFPLDPTVLQAHKWDQPVMSGEGTKGIKGQREFSGGSVVKVLVYSQSKRSAQFNPWSQN